MMRRAIQLAVFLSVAIMPVSYAREESISVGQSPSGDVLVSLNGQIFYCDSFLGAFVGSPTFLITANQVNVVSKTAPGECAAPPPGFVSPPPTPYTLTVNAGHLPDGVYHVSWAFSYEGSGYTYQEFSTTFAVSGGAPVAVPILSPGLSIVLLVCLAWVGMMAIHR